MTQIVTYNGLVGYVLEKRRQSLGYDQGYIADVTLISQPVLSRLEKGKASITIDQLFKLSKVLDIAPDKVIEQAQHYAEALANEKGIQVTTTKESGNTKQSGNQGSSILAGAAIGAVLTLLLSRK